MKAMFKVKDQQEDVGPLDMITWQEEILFPLLDVCNKNKFLYNPGSNKTDN